MSDRPPKTSSGEHPAVQAFREKLESIQENALEKLRDLNRKLDEEIGSRPPRKDPRRDGDSDPPTDVVEIPDEEKEPPAP
jgi:hypothetical protein